MVAAVLGIRRAARTEGEQRLAGRDVADVDSRTRRVRRVVRGQHARRLDAGRWRRASSGRPATASMTSAATPPGRSSRSVPPSTLTMVDSTPTGVGPPSTMSGIRSPRSACDGLGAWWR